MTIIRVLNSEKSSRQLELENKLSLVIDTFTVKDSLIEELKNTYGLKVDKINIQYTHKGYKKAIVTLNKKHTSDEIANMFGLVY
jgi:ribosomal protein L23